jgi:hypothetical protein
MNNRRVPTLMTSCAKWRATLMFPGKAAATPCRGLTLADPCGCVKRKRRDGYLRRTYERRNQHSPTIAEQGSCAALSFLEEGCRQKKGTLKGRKGAKGGKTRAAAPKKEAKAGREAAKPAREKEARVRRAPRAKTRRSWNGQVRAPLWPAS